MIKLIPGGITKIPVDAIVNAANSFLPGGGVVDVAIKLVSGEDLNYSSQEVS